MPPNSSFLQGRAAHSRQSTDTRGKTTSRRPHSMPHRIGRRLPIRTIHISFLSALSVMENHETRSRSYHLSPLDSTLSFVRIDRLKSSPPYTILRPGRPTNDHRHKKFPRGDRSSLPMYYAPVGISLNGAQFLLRARRGLDIKFVAKRASPARGAPYQTTHTRSRHPFEST